MARIGDCWRHQIAETGHAGRLADIDLIADLGVTAVRYPILWERIAPERPDHLDFAWTDERLAKLRERGIEVIATSLISTPRPGPVGIGNIPSSARNAFSSAQ